MTDSELDRLADLVVLKLQGKGIIQDRVYSQRQAAELLGFESDHGPKTLKQIPESMLPRVPITPRRVGYLGRDLLAYVEGQRRAS